MNKFLLIAVAGAALFAAVRTHADPLPGPYVGLWCFVNHNSVRRQRSLDRPGGLNKGEFLAHRNVHRSEDEAANPSIEGTG